MKHHNRHSIVETPLKKQNADMKLNLGAGNKTKQGWVNVDIVKSKGINVKWDLNKIPYPFESNMFNEVEMRSILEHLKEPYEVMLEVHRICKPKARIHIRTVHFSSIHCWGDLQHKRGFSIRSFATDDIKYRFKVKGTAINFSWWKIWLHIIWAISPIWYEKNLAYIFPANDICFELEVRK